jgi:hydrogenase maturation protease
MQAASESPGGPDRAPAPSRSRELAEKIANAVLYEGYILYPYRPSSVKNRQRWTFGGIYPAAYSRGAGGADACAMQTECLVEAGEGTRIDVRVRFLHIQDRVVGALDPPLPDLPATGTPDYRPVPALQMGDRVLRAWQEAVEREIAAPDLNVADLLVCPHEQAFAFPATGQIEAVRDSVGPVLAVIRREQRALAGMVTVAATRTDAGPVKLAVRVENRTPWRAPDVPPPSGSFGWEREDAVLQAFVSTHTVLEVRDGAFISLIDPPAEYKAAAAVCSNVGTWPVLAGEAGARDLLLSSPIILYDYPEVAPESPGDLFDGTEIDEILTLRILTMTDAEKQEMRQSDPRGRALLDRTETLPAEQLMKLHGTLRNIQPLEGGL